MKKAQHRYENQEHAKVVLFPPLVGLSLITVAIALQLFFPFRLTSATTMVIIVGAIILTVGIGLQLICLCVLKQAKTTPLFQKLTTTIDGPRILSRKSAELMTQNQIGELFIQELFNGFPAGALRVAAAYY